MIQHKPKTSWWSKPQVKEWHTQSSLLKVSFGEKEPTLIGEGQRKKAYYGFAHFKKDNAGRVSKVRVVIKKFKIPLTDLQAQKYIELLNFLREKRFPLPKSGLVKVTPEIEKSLKGVVKNGEWIAIQQFFGNQRKTAIVDRFVEVEKQITAFRAQNKSYQKYTDFSLLFLGKRMARTDAAKLLAMLINLKVRPRFDVLAPLKKGERNIGSIPFDYDLIVEEMMSTKKPSAGDLAVRLVELINKITPNNNERERLYKISLNNIESPEVRKYMNFVKNSLLFSEETKEVE